MLQEVEPAAHQAIAQRLEGHVGVYAQRQGRPDGASIFVRRARMSLDHVQAHGADASWILAGDLNATSNSCVLAAASERGLLLSARAQRPWDTCNANARPRKLDYLLIQAGGGLEPHPGTLPKLGRDTALPSLDEPSDHLPLRVDYRFAD